MSNPDPGVFREPCKHGVFAEFEVSPAFSRNFVFITARMEFFQNFNFSGT